MWKDLIKKFDENYIQVYSAIMRHKPFGLVSIKYC